MILNGIINIESIKENKNKTSNETIIQYIMQLHK